MKKSEKLYYQYFNRFSNPKELIKFFISEISGKIHKTTIPLKLGFVSLEPRNFENIENFFLQNNKPDY